MSSRPCDHKFVDSNVCLKCGVSIGELRAADAADWEAFRDGERELRVDELDVEDMVANMHFRIGAAHALTGTVDRERARELGDKLWDLMPFLKALGRLALEHRGRTQQLWAEALKEPMPFGLAPIGMPRVKEGS